MNSKLLAIRISTICVCVCVCVCFISCDWKRSDTLEEVEYRDISQSYDYYLEKRENLENAWLTNDTNFFRIWVDSLRYVDNCEFIKAVNMLHNKTNFSHGYLDCSDFQTVKAQNELKIGKENIIKVWKLYLNSRILFNKYVHWEDLTMEFVYGIYEFETPISQDELNTIESTFENYYEKHKDSTKIHLPTGIFHDDVLEKYPTYLISDKKMK